MLAAAVITVHVGRRVPGALLVGPHRRPRLVPDRVFVTGGTGFIGKALVEALVHEGRTVRALARSDAAAATLAELGAEPVRGDVLDGESLAAGLDGCDVAFHVAGANAFCLPDPSPLYEVNVTGSRTVVLAAAAAGIRRLVYTSSAATLGEERGSVGSEEAVHRGWFLSDYERSKFEAERAVLDVARETGLDVVCVNPSSVQGPGRTGGTAKLLLGYLNGTLRSAVDTRLSVVDIADCTSGHLLAEAKGAPGERYVLCGASLTVREGLELLGRITGIDERPRFSRRASRSRSRPESRRWAACGGASPPCAGRWCGRSSTATPTTARGRPASSGSSTRRSRRRSAERLPGTSSTGSSSARSPASRGPLQTARGRRRWSSKRFSSPRTSRPMLAR